MRAMVFRLIMLKGNNWSTTMKSQ